MSPHLQMLNSNPHCEELNLPQFSQLPKELRLLVWKYALQRHRIIRVRLQDNEKERTADPSPGNGDLNCQSQRYRVVVEGLKVSSKLLCISRESRAEALSFYRVHLPCGFMGTGTTWGVKSLVPGTFHFNPEYDFLHISPEWGTKDSLYQFLHHLKTRYDPRHVGLLNLAMDTNDVRGYNLSWNNDAFSIPQPSEFDPSIRAAFVETITQLQEVFFISTPRAGRQIVGPLSGLPTTETIFNRSFPIMALPPTFERLGRDPRPIAHDLRKVLVDGGSDPRGMVQMWQKIVKRWSISQTRTSYRFLLAYDPTLQGQIPDYRSAKTWLQKDDDYWNGRGPTDGFLKDANVKWPVGALHENYKNEDLEKAVRPAFGFWLFPVDALGPLREEGVPEDQGFRSGAKRILNMSSYWPELALSSLV